MEKRWEKIGMLAFSMGILGWLGHEIFTSGLNWRNVLLIAYVAVVFFALIMDLKTRPIMGVAPADKAETKKPEEIVLQIIREKIRARRRDFLPHVKISKSTLVRLLDKMEHEGLIEQIGDRKQSFYKLKV